jgi:hypothetical protein
MLNLLAKAAHPFLPKAYIEKVGMDEFVATHRQRPGQADRIVKDDHVTLVPSPITTVSKTPTGMRYISA